MVLLTIGLLYLILRRIDLAILYETIISVSIVSIIFVLITAGIKTAFEIRNWYSYLTILPGNSPSLSEIIKSHLIGRALHFTIPGGYGVVGKILFLKNSKKKSLLSVGIERFFQTWLIFLFASLAGFFYFENINLFIRIAVMLIVLLAPILAYYLKILFKNNELFFTNYLQKVPEIISIQILYMIITILQYYVILNQIGSLTLFQTFISVPLILFANTIPITYGGLGLREIFAISVLQRFSYEPAQAITTSLTIFFINTVLPSLVGAIMLMFHKKSPT